MILDLIWAAGEVLSILALLCGAYVVLLETEPFSTLFTKKLATPVPLLAEDLQLVGEAAEYAGDGHALSGKGVMNAPAAQTTISRRTKRNPCNNSGQA